MSKGNQEIKAEVELLNHQLEFVMCPAKFPALIGGYGCGKTEALFYRLFNMIFKYGPLFKEANSGLYICAVYEPTYDLITTILYQRFEELFNLYNIQYVLNKSEKTILVKELNSLIMLRTMEDPHKIIGYQTADSIIDELDTLSEDKAEEVFKKIIGRNRLKKPNGDINTIGVTTTPEGFKFVYKTWKLTKKPKDFVIIQGKTENNKFLDKEYVENLKSLYPAAQLRAYMNGEFVNLKGNSVYEDFDRDLNDTKEKQKLGETLHIGMDFNVGKMSATIGVIRKGIVYIVDEIFGVLDTPAMIKEINRRYSNYEIIVYPDASGVSRKSVNASESDIKLLKEYFIVKAKSKNPKIKNRVMTVQSMILNMSGERRLFVNSEKCKNLVENLEQQIYDEHGDPDKRAGQDHMLDALGYFIYWHFGIDNNKIKIIDTPF